MKKSPDSTGSLVLMLLALVLTAALGVWCVSLIVSADGLRDQRSLNDERLAALNSIHAGIDDLNNLLVAASPEEPWRRLHQQTLTELSSLRDGDTQRFLEAPLDKLEDVLTGLNAVALELLGETTTSTGIDAWRDEHRALTDLANEAHSEATILINRSTAHIASRLDAKWTALNVLAVLALTATVLLLLRVRHERRIDGRERRTVRELRESDKRFRAMLAALPDVVIVLDASGRYRHVYTADKALLVDTPEELVGKTIHEVLPKEAARSIQAVIDRAIATSEVQQYEYPLETAGEQRWFSARVVEFGSSDDPCVMWVARELTARKRAERAQRDSEARFRQLAENLDQVIWLSTWPTRQVVYVNGAYETIWGRSRQSLYDHPQSWMDCIHPEDQARVMNDFEQKMLEGSYDEEFRIITDDNSIRWVRDRGFPIRDRNGKVYRIAGISEDITERKRAVEQFRESEERFRSAFEHTAVGMALVSPGGVFMRTNAAFCAVIGYSEEELIQMTFRDITHPDDLERSVSETQRVLTGEVDAITMEKRYLHKSGKVLWGLTSVSSVRGPDGRPQYLVAETQDITERKKAESALQDREERLRQLTENIREVFWMTSADRQEMIYVNPAYQEIWGRSCQSLYEQPSQWIEAIHDDDRDRVGRAFAVAHLGNFDEEYRIVRPDGTIRRIRDRAFPVLDDDGAVRRLAGIAEDITELAEHREHLERLVEERTMELRDSHARLRVADQLAMIGTLSAGLVHDMNNVLFSVRCSLDSISVPEDRPELREVCGTVRSSVEYLQRLCDGLRWLAVDPEDAQACNETTTLSAWWAHVQPLMNLMVPEHVTIETDLPETLPAIAVAPHRLTQAVLNLVLNAAEASHGAGSVRIWARHDASPHEVIVGVTDQGGGMTEEVRRRAFDPFFSTKKRSFSTGLGLSVVHGVVTMSGGTARIESEQGRGTTVTLSFPATEGDATPTHGQASISIGDPLRAEWVSHMVRLAGYEIQPTRNGSPADGSSLWVTEPSIGRAAMARDFHEQRGGRVILLGSGGPEWAGAGAVVVGDPGSLEAIRSAVRQVTPSDQEDA